MTLKDALNLKPGDRLTFNQASQFEAHGIVTKCGPAFITIRFDDGEFGAVHPRDMRLFTLEES